MKNINFRINENCVFVETNTFKKEKQSKFLLLWLILSGLVIGWINGFWGGGGGMVCVPVLISILKLPEKSAHATALLIMLPLSICSFVVYMLKGSIDVMMAVQVGAGFVFGGATGAILLKNMSNVILRIVFAGVIIAGGLKLIL